MNDAVNPFLQLIEERASAPFSPLGDDVVLGILIACFFILVTALVEDSGYLRRLIGSYNMLRVRSQGTEVHTSRALWLRVSLIVLTAVSVGVCFLCWYHASGLVTERRAALIIVLLCGAGALAYLAVKSLLYFCINILFFDRKSAAAWTQTYTDTYIFSGLAFYVLAVVAVFTPMTASLLLIFALILVGIVQIWLLFKAYRIFFEKKYGYVQLFVYLCTLEWIPLLIVGKLFVQYGITV